jgi:DNA recombination protein RmuC
MSPFSSVMLGSMIFNDWPLTIIALLLLVIFVVSIVLWRRIASIGLPDLRTRFDRLEKGQEHIERALGDEMSRNREESSLNSRQAREEISCTLNTFANSLQGRMADIAGLQKDQLDSFSKQLLALTQSNENKLEAVRSTVESGLQQIREDNSKQIDRMRQTVDVQLQGTLEKRLGESFKLVSERLEQVHKGLGEMQSLASGVGDLKRALTNVKTRGGWGEIQLEALLEEILAPEQYQKNVRVNEVSAEVVEFAIKLPGGAEGGGDPVWLPIDAKFPMEDYQRLVEAQEQSDLDGIEQAGRMLMGRMKSCAKDICVKYISPPRTTDFGIMFLPTEGLYAEAVRRPGLVEALQRECRVVIAGPTTLAALLNSLQMGFRTLAIQKRSSEVWKLLAAVKAEFGKFGDALAGVKKKLDQASNTMEDAARRSRSIERKLRGVQELPSAEAQSVLAPSDPDAGEEVL